jgi:predicted RNA-binding protein with PIN domain
MLTETLLTNVGELDAIPAASLAYHARMRYLVDGYNVTMADDATRHLDRDAQRLALVRRLAVRGPELLGPGPKTVIFDGGVLRDDEVHGDVEMRFSGEGSADDVIVRLAEAEGGNVVVVTSDRELRSRVREHAGRSVDVRPVSTLFEAAKGRRRRKPDRRAPGGLPAGHETITAELEDLWLPKKER